MHITKEHSINIFLGIIILISLSACVSTGPKFVKIDSTHEGLSNVYIYRPFNVMGGAAPSVLHNGEKIANVLGNRNFIKYSVAPGSHTFKTSLLLVRAIPVTINIERPGETHYIRVEYKFGVPYAFKMVEVSESKALAELPSCFEVQVKTSISKSPPPIMPSSPTVQAHQAQPVPST
jgi:hypothetical protein